MQNTLVQLLHNSVDRFPEKTAVIQGETTLTYIELWNKACGVAHYLLRNNFKNNDKASLLLDNSAEYIIAYYGVLIAGGSVIGLNTAAKSRDLVNWIEHSDSKFVFASINHAEVNDVLDILPDNKCQFIFVGLEITKQNDHDWNQIQMNSDLPESCIEWLPDEKLASIIYTSGTTGKPKGVMLSHTNLYENIVSILTYLKLNNNDSIVNVLPFYYSYGNSVLHSHLAAGATLILENSMLYPQKILSVLADKKVTGFSGVPSTFNLILNRTKLADFDLSSLRYMTQAGGPMAPANVERLKKELPGIDFFIMYGQTEASARLSYLPPEQLENKPGSIGKAIPGVRLEIRDENQKAVSISETGEIYAYGKNIMLGYWKDKEATTSVIYDGWLKTGDLAYQDEDDYFYIVGRSTDMIKSGAHRISPKDIEEVILELDGVEEVAVVGVADVLLGQIIKAVVVIAPGYTMDKMKLMRHCKENLASYKLPKNIEFKDEIPKTASGKIRRFMLEK